MKLILASLLLVSTSFALTVDEQISKAKAQSDSLLQVAARLTSGKIAAVLDTLCLEDSTLTADRVRVMRSDDETWVNVLLTHLDATDLRSVIVEVKAVIPRELVQVKGDTLYMQHPAARAVLPVIAAALRE